MEKYTDKKEYIQGFKDDPEKSQKTAVDKLWRAQFNAPSYVILPQEIDDREDLPEF